MLCFGEVHTPPTPLRPALDTVALVKLRAYASYPQILLSCKSEITNIKPQPQLTTVRLNQARFSSVVNIQTTRGMLERAAF